MMGIKISREYTETLDMNHCLKNLGNKLVQTPYSTDEKTEVWFMETYVEFQSHGCKLMELRKQDLLLTFL